MDRGNHDIDRGGYHDVASHIAPLALAIQKYGTDVLELGCGWYSTPLIHALSHVALSIDDDGEWAQKFSGFTVVVTYKGGIIPMAKATTRPWQVVFIDSANGEDRVACAKLFLDKPCCIVIHDSQEPYWQDLLKTVKFQRHFDFMSPRTSFISNVLDVTKE